MALAVPLSRFTSRVGGGSAFFVRPLRDFMRVMLADYQPGGLTSVFIMFGFGCIIAVCLIGALITYLIKQKEAAQSLLIAAGIMFLFGWLLIIIASILGRHFNLV